MTVVLPKKIIIKYNAIQRLIFVKFSSPSIFAMMQ